MVKKKAKKESQPLSTFNSIPDEIIENCLARISRWNYPSLSLVSKKFRSLLSSDALYKTRSQIGTTETYVCLQLAMHESPKWFSLWPKPNQTQTITKRRGKTQNPRGNLLVPVPSTSPLYYVPCNSTIAVGSEIYVIGGSLTPSSAVRILDCRSHMWRDAPYMTVARKSACTEFLDEKIYVIGGCDIKWFANNRMDVFDLKTQSWTSFPCPCEIDELIEGVIVNVIEGKLHVVFEGCTKEYIYEPKQGTWEIVREESSFLSVEVEAYTVVENVIYCCTEDGIFMWYDFKSGKWEEIKGLEELRKHRKGLSKDMVNHGGKLLVMWEPKPNRTNSIFKPKNKVWFAEISLETRFGVRLISLMLCLHSLTCHIIISSRFGLMTL